MMRNGMWALLIFLCLGAVTIAQNASDDIFSESSGATGIMPPPIPGQDASRVGMAKVGTVNAGAGSVSDVPVIFTLLDVGNRSIVRNVHVLVEYTGTKTLKTLMYVGDEGTLSLLLPPGEGRLILKVDEVATPGGDYYAREELQVGGSVNRTISLFPTGSVQGRILRDGLLVPNARVSIKCSALYGNQEQVRSDASGSFSADWLPVGSCAIMAFTDNYAGSVGVNLAFGQLSTVTIPLETKVSSFSTIYIVFFIVIIVAVGFSLHYVITRKRTPKEKESAKRLRDVLVTLSQKEREIVELLQKEGEVTQAKVVYTLMIPKTTLSRSLDVLEQKKIIGIKKFGKAKKIALTDWILEKERKGP